MGSTGWGCPTLSQSICSLEIRLFIYSLLAGVAHWTLGLELSYFLIHHSKSCSCNLTADHGNSLYL